MVRKIRQPREVTQLIVLILNIIKPVLTDAIPAVTKLQHMPEEMNALVFRILRMSDV